MTLPRWPWLVGAALVGLGLGFLLFRGHAPNPVIIAQADSALAHSHPEQAHRDTLTRTITRIIRDTARAHAAEEAARRAQSTSDSALRLLAGAQTARDSLPLVLVALTAQTTRGDSLDAALQDQKVRFGRLAAADSSYRQAAESRIGTLETTLAGTVKELKRARVTGPCQIGTVAAGWSPITGRADLVLGASCSVPRALGRLF